MTITEQLVTRIYRDVVHREPDAGGLAFWAANFDSGGSCEVLFHLLYAERLATIPPAPPPPPPIIPPSGNDLSDGAQHTFQFYEGQPQAFSFRSPGGYVELTVFPPAGTTGKTGWWSVDGGPWESFSASGSDFRFKPINSPVGAGVHTVQVKVIGILGAGQFALQAQGAVG